MSIYRRIKNKAVSFVPPLSRKLYARGKHPEIKVLVAGLMMCRNLGDVVISDCTQYLLEKAAKETDIRKLRLSTIDIRREKDKENLNRVRNSDLVVFPGGGFIKYKQENFPKEMGRIISRAEHYGIPVMYNAMGVEDYDAGHPGCVEMQKLLESYSNRYITSRDFADLLNETYLKNVAVSAERVADPAVFCGEVYEIKRDETSDVVGLGVARSGLFVDHGVPVTGTDLLEIWSSIIKTLDEKGIKWKLFTNGLRQDEDFLTELIAFLGREADREEISLPSAQSSRELVENIAFFSSIIATRMHANIIAFSLGIPSVAFVWNDKLRFFGESIGCSERYLEYDKISDARFVVDTLLKAQRDGYGEGVLEREKTSAYKSVSGYFVPFSENLLQYRRRDLTNKKLVCYGLPNLESEKLNRELFEKHVEYFVSDDAALVGSECLGRPVYCAEKLRKNRRKNFVIVSETVDYTPVAKKLINMGYAEKRDFTNMHSYKRYVFKKGNVFI